MDISSPFLPRNMNNNSLRSGSLLMTLGAVAFIGYGIVFLFRSLYGSGFELGVDTLGGLSRDSLAAYNAALGAYVTHLHVAVSGFIISTGIATALLSWYGVRARMWWAYLGAVISPVVALAIALPLHYMGEFEVGFWHLGPIYVAVLVFVVGVILAFMGLRPQGTPAAAM